MDQDEPDEEVKTYHDANVEIHQRWVAANAKLVSAQDAEDREGIITAQNQVDSAGGDFINANRGLAAALAKPFLNSGSMHSAQEDYMSAALMGLWEAFVKWDPSKNVTFATFSRQYIKGRTQRTVRSVEFSQISQTDFNRRGEVRTSWEKLSKQLDRPPTFAEVAADTGLAATLVERALQKKTSYLDTPQGDGEMTLGQTLEEIPEEISLTEEQAEKLESLFGALSMTEIWVLVQRYGLAGGPPQSLVEVADGIGIGREIARRSEKTAIKKLIAEAQK